METLILGIVLVVLFVITWIVIACNAPTSEMPLPPHLQMKPLRDFENEALRAENRTLKDQVRYLEMRAHPHAWCLSRNQPCCPCEIRKEIILAKTPDEQALIELVKEIGKPMDKIKKELGIK